MNKSVDVDLQSIESAEDLPSLNELLKQSMKQMQIQRLIRGPNLASIVESIIALSAHRRLAWRRAQEHHQLDGRVEDDR